MIKLKGSQYLIISLYFVAFSFLIVKSAVFPAFYHYKHAIDFFEAHSVYHIVVLTCFKTNDQLRFIKYISAYYSKGFVHISRLQTQKNYLDFLYIRHGRIGVVLDGTCCKKDFFSLFGKFKFFDVKYYWLIITKKDNTNSLFSNTNHNVDSNVFVLYIDSAQVDDIYIYEYYNPSSKKGGTSVKAEIGTFKNLSNYHIMTGSNKFFRRRDLTGVSFDGTIVLHEPYSEPLKEYLKNNSNREINTYSRYHARLIHYCKSVYNFSFKINVTKLFGYQKEHGTMDGLVGGLGRHEIDFGLSPLFMRTDRAELITFGRPTYKLKSAFVFLNPKSKEAFKLFLRPLSANVWYCLLGTCLLAVILMKFIRYVTNVYDLNLDYNSSMLCIIGILSQQGAVVYPSILSGRMVIFFTITSTYLVYVFYSGSLVSSLLNVPLDPIENVGDLLKAKFKIGVEDNRFNREYFKYTTDNSSLYLYKSAVAEKEHEVYLSPSDGLQRIKNGDYAFHVELAKAYPFIKNDFKTKLCQVRQISMFKPAQLYASYAKHSPFRDIMEVCLHKIAESGTMEKELVFWENKKPDCLYANEICTGILEVYPILICIVVGVLLSMLILCLEFSNK